MGGKIYKLCIDDLFFEETTQGPIEEMKPDKNMIIG